LPKKAAGDLLPLQEPGKSAGSNSWLRKEEKRLTFKEICRTAGFPGPIQKGGATELAESVWRRLTEASVRA